MHRYIRCTLCALPTHLRTPWTMLLSIPPFKTRSSGKKKKRGADDCNFARGRESSWSLTPRKGVGKARGNLLNSTRYASLVAAVCSAAATI